MYSLTTKLTILIYCRLFITPHFDGIFPDFTLTLRRRRNDKEIKLTGFDTFRYVGEDSFEDGNVHTSKPNIVPQIYACATMWHETRQEMTQLLKSMFRCDCIKLIFRILFCICDIGNLPSINDPRFSCKRLLNFNNTI